MVCSVMNNFSFDQKALTLKCDLVEIHTSEGLIDEHDGVLILLCFSRH